MGWSPLTEPQMEAIRNGRHKAAEKIAHCISMLRKPAVVSKVERTVERVESREVSAFKDTDLVSIHKTSAVVKAFSAPSIIFLSRQERDALDGNTLNFLRANPVPRPKGKSKEECEEYFAAVRVYLHKLTANTGLENRGQRINEFCQLSAAKIFSLPVPPPKELMEQLADTIIDKYRGPEETKSEDEEPVISLKKGFSKLENQERAQVLGALIKLQLAALGGTTKVNPKFYSTIKQWERLIVPGDTALTTKIARLTSDGVEPLDMTRIIEVDSALHKSPVGLERLYEGQIGLQAALSHYGVQKGEVTSTLRKVADRLAMRNGDALLVNQFMNFYS
jgi:hypothetical protein